MPEKAKATRKRRPPLKHLVEDAPTGPEDPDVAAALIAAWLERLPDRPNDKPVKK